MENLTANLMANHTTQWTHGGTDALAPARHDFSTNSNACGPCPQALAAVQAADPTCYPDPAYTVLRQQLAAFHAVTVDRVLLAGSASEAIFRITAWAHQQGVRTVHLPAHHYGDYARAAQAWGLQRSSDDAAALSWACEPTSPLGQAHTGWPGWLSQQTSSADAAPVQSALPAARHMLVLDQAYAPLRLSGTPSLCDAQRNRLWQLFTPNKALGLTGVRAAYVIAPDACAISAAGHSMPAAAALDQLAASWPIGAHGVAMLLAWVTPEVQAWVANSLPTLRGWKARQIDLLARAGWRVQPSDANYFCAQPPQALDLAALRSRYGIKLRDATSFGLPGWFRLGVRAIQAQDALAAALQKPHN